MSLQREPWSAHEAAITIWLEDGYGNYIAPPLLETLFAKNVSFRGIIESTSVGQPGAAVKDIDTFPQGFAIDIEELYYRKALQLDQFLDRNDRYRVEIKLVNEQYSGTAPFENDTHVFRMAAVQWNPLWEENDIAVVKLSFTAEEMDPESESESTVAVPKHNWTHFADGDDPITPQDIGAATEDHNHNSVYAPATHSHNASDITAGIFNLDRIPSTLTGKDADTVDGKHAADFATSTHNHDSAYAPLSHASRHKAGGADPLTPADIGAAPASHTHDDKADRVTGATGGHLAGLNAAGNLTDSGYAPDDFAAAEHTHSGYQLVSEKNMGGGYAGLEANGKLSLSVIPNGINAVTSVNSKTGAVVLNYTDVGADVSGAAASVQTNLDTAKAALRWCARRGC